MGKIEQGILGEFSGKIGPVVGCKGKSGNYIRAHNGNAINPRTQKQQEQRGRFATAFGFLKTITPFIRIGYAETAQGKTPFNAAMSYIMRKALKDEGNQTAIDFNRLMVSTGSLMPIFDGTVRISGNCASFEWKNNGGTGNADDTDSAMLLVYNKEKEMATYDMAAATRSERYAALALPADWDKDTLICYLGFRSADGNYVSNSLRLKRE